MFQGGAGASVVLGENSRQPSRLVVLTEDQSQCSLCRDTLLTTTFTMSNVRLSRAIADYRRVVFNISSFLSYILLCQLETIQPCSVVEQECGGGEGGKRNRACPLYKTTQERLLADRSAAARWILDGVEEVACSINKEAIVSAYQKGVGQGLSCSFSPAEVLRALKKMKSGPGPDRIRKTDLLRWDPKGVKLADLFNAIVLSGRLPACLRGSRTTLIPKSMSSSLQRDINQWRPITISSVILRTLSSVLTSRLTEVCPAPRQRGFIPAPGCSENIVVVDGLINLCKKDGGSWHVSSLTSQRPSLGEYAIGGGAGKRGVDETLRDFINNSYKRCFTRLKSNGGLTGKIRLRRGLSRGTHVSLAFQPRNRPLLRLLEEKGAGVTVKDLTVSSLAFFCQLSTSLPARFLSTTAHPGTFKVLLILRRISEAKLKPTQRVDLLKIYGLPRVTYIADLGDVSRAHLDVCDRDIRTKVKAWLHQEQSTADGLLYSRARDGGLGLVRLGALIPALGLRRLSLMLTSADEYTRVVSAATLPPKLLELVRLTVESSAGVDGGSESGSPTANAPPVSLSAWRHAEFDRWSKLCSQGVGVSVFRDDRISKVWLCNQAERLRFESETITALKLRSNAMPTLVSGARGRPTAQNLLSCRLCKSHRETMRHIVSSCPGLQKNRMSNHNKICELLANEATRRGWSVDRERRMTTPAGTAIIADVAIGFEGSEDTLSDLAKCKYHKYRPFASVVRGLYPSLRRVRVQGFPIGARGKWHGPNGSLLGALGLSKSQKNSFARLLSKRALLFTIDLFKIFFKNVLSKRPPMTRKPSSPGSSEA
uniref:Reverse transcriptase domain-containing protein n=1 Tax=Labrus bergylta TaxID=56723 RepID=A0A3Q3KVH3_9LABR